MRQKSVNFSFILPVLAILFSLTSCSRNEKSPNGGNPRLQVRLTDSPFPYAKEVWVDIQKIQIVLGDSSNPVELDGAHPGLYNLFDLTNGKDTLIADATIPSGTISQVRLILGDNSYLITENGEKVSLKTPSGQESGLKVLVHQAVAGGILYRLTLDFDAGRSIVKAGNSGQYLLKPVLRIISLVPSGGDIKGVVLPDSIRTSIFALSGTDTVASTVTDTASGAFLIKDVPAGNYSLIYIPADSTYQTASGNAAVTLGQVTIVDTLRLLR
jgi:hypothetical protein